MADIEIRDSDVSITLAVDPDTLRQIIRDELAPLRRMIMSESAQIHDVAAMVGAFTKDALARFDRLQAAVDSPSDESNLSEAAQGELTGIRNILTAARQAAGLGDENGDGDPAVTTSNAGSIDPTTVPATADGSAPEAEAVADGGASGDAAVPADGAGDVSTDVAQPVE